MSCGRELLSVETQRFLALFAVWGLLFDSAYPIVSAWYFSRVGHGVGRGRAPIRRECPIRSKAWRHLPQIVLLRGILNAEVIASGSQLRNGDAVSKECYKPRRSVNFSLFGPGQVNKTTPAALPTRCRCCFEVVFLMEKKSKSTVWLNRGFIIAGRIGFVKRIFVLENMRTCIV